MRAASTEEGRRVKRDLRRGQAREGAAARAKMPVMSVCLSVTACLHACSFSFFTNVFSFVSPILSNHVCLFLLPAACCWMNWRRQRVWRGGLGLLLGYVQSHIDRGMNIVCVTRVAREGPR